MSQQLSNSSNLSNKDYLIKYCYFNSTSVGESFRNYTIWLLTECNDDSLLSAIRLLFDTYIMPFYIDKTNRTYFNKLRYYFMKFVLMLLINDEDNYIKIEDFYQLYPKFSINAGILEESKWYDIAMPLIAKAKEAYYDISVYS